MEGLLFILDQTGRTVARLQAENEALRHRITELEAQIASE